MLLLLSLLLLVLRGETLLFTAAGSARRASDAMLRTERRAGASHRERAVRVAAALDGGRSQARDAAAVVATPAAVRRSGLVQMWGVLGVAAYLAYGVKKVVPIVREGLHAMTSSGQWLFLAATLGFFAYVEGYKGFQKGFSPRVVSRAWVVSTQREAGAASGDVGPPLWHKVLAPAFCIGYFHGTRKRVVSSWAVTAIIFLVVVAVKRLANPYRGIVDAGVIVGLLWGSTSVILLYARSLMVGHPPEYDPCLPEGSPYQTTS